MGNQAMGSFETESIQCLINDDGADDFLFARPQLVPFVHRSDIKNRFRFASGTAEHY